MTSHYQEAHPTPSGCRGMPLCRMQETEDWKRRTQEAVNVIHVNWINYSCVSLPNFASQIQKSVSKQELERFIQRCCPHAFGCFSWDLVSSINFSRHFTGVWSRDGLKQLFWREMGKKKQKTKLRCHGKKIPRLFLR